jgi:hypothetical protein
LGHGPPITAFALEEDLAEPLEFTLLLDSSFLLDEDFTTLLLESSFLTEEQLLSLLTELEEFLVVAEELDSLDFSTDEEDSSLGSGAGAELLDSSPQATNKTAEINNAAKYFTENLRGSNNNSS